MGKFQKVHGCRYLGFPAQILRKISTNTNGMGGRVYIERIESLIKNKQDGRIDIEMEIWGGGGGGGGEHCIASIIVY